MVGSRGKIAIVIQKPRDTTIILLCIVEISYGRSVYYISKFTDHTHGNKAVVDRARDNTIKNHTHAHTYREAVLRNGG